MIPQKLNIETSTITVTREQPRQSDSHESTLRRNTDLKAKAANGADNGTTKASTCSNTLKVGAEGWSIDCYVVTTDNNRKDVYDRFGEGILLS